MVQKKEHRIFVFYHSMPENTVLNSVPYPISCFQCKWVHKVKVGVRHLYGFSFINTEINTLVVGSFGKLVQPPT